MKRKSLIFGAIIIASFVITSCSTDYNKKFTGKVWASVNNSFYGEYLWKFDGINKMINLNHASDSKSNKAFYNYKIEGNKIEITRNGVVTEYKIEFINENSFNLISEKDKGEFKVASFKDSIVGSWRNTQISDNNGFLERIELSPDNDCEFSVKGDNVFSDMYRGNYEVDGTSLKIIGKENNSGEDEKDFSGEISIKILTLDSIKITKDGADFTFKRDLFQK